MTSPKNVARRYQWQYPSDWLTEKIETMPEYELVSFCKRVIALLDSDQIQNEFQEDMSADGYFTPLGKKANNG